MPEFLSNLCLEIPSDVPQQEVWQLEKRIQQIEGVSTDLQESKSMLIETLLFVQLAITTVGPLLETTDTVKTVYEVARTIYEFIHRGSKHYDVTIRKNGVHIEIKNMTIEDIQRLISET